MAKNMPLSKSLLLKQTEIFSPLSYHDRKCIAESSEYKEYMPETPVFLQNETGDALYIVESGEVVIQKQDDLGRKTSIARFVPGDCFGELDLFTDSVRNASSYVSDKTRLLIFPKPGRKFTGFLEENPVLSARILHEILVNIAWRIRRANTLIKENSPLMQELRNQVYRDKLTGLFNKTFLAEEMNGRVNRGGTGFFLFMTKPDNFKMLNDTYGHDAGDRAIRIMGRSLRDFIKDDEKTARYRGNAMAVLLDGNDRKEASDLAIRIMDFMNNLDVSEATGEEEFHITASIGITFFPDDGEQVEDLLDRAHELALTGRSRGGNCILFSSNEKVK